MPRRRDEHARVIGPTWLESRKRWRVTTVDPKANGGTGGRRYGYFGSLEEADEYREVSEQQLAMLEGTTIDEALTAHEKQLDEQGNEQKGTEERMRRLRLFFGDVLETQVARLRPERAAKLYDSFRVGRSADYHRNTLGNARGFLDWCKTQGWCSENALSEVKGVGKRKAGKLQLTGDEARKLYAWCLWKAQRRGNATERRDSEAAIGVLMLLLMALRQADVIKRQVRDVDLDATVLRVSKGKTEKSNRVRKVPEALQGMLRRHIDGRSPLEPLFVADGGGHHTNAWLRSALDRFCRDAGVPRVCPHALKGTAASVLAETGELGDKIADHLSHESQATTQRHYLRSGVTDEAAAARGLAVISGGRR